ncbi:MAPEG family protein [Pseudoalteromonas xiamenensis]
MLEKFLILTIFAQVILTYGILVVMGRRRFSAAKQKLIQKEDFATMRLETAPDHVRVADRSFINQFEIPVLFYVASLTALSLNAVSVWFVAFSCVFVITRFAHAIIHLGKNTVIVRYRIFLISCLMNLLQWLCLLFTVFVGI